MKTWYYARQLLPGIAVFVLLLLLFTGQILASAPPTPDAVISLVNVPLPPSALRPGEAEQIQWEIVSSSTPVSVSYSILDVDGNVVEESEVYPGTSGLAVTRQYTLPLDYTLPAGKPFERYQVRIDYYSMPGGLESSAETVFWVTEATGNLVVDKFSDLDGDGVQGLDEPGVEGGFFSIEIQGEDLGDLTGEDGRILWNDTPIGTYTVSEHLPSHAIPTTPVSDVVTLAPGETMTVTFGNRFLGDLRVCTFADYNGDGQHDPAEPFLEDIDVSYLNTYGEDGAGSTGAAGCYTWFDVPVGIYAVSQELPAACQTTSEPYPPEVTVEHVGTAQTELGSQCYGTLVAKAFDDEDMSGTWQPSEAPLGGVAVSWINEYGESDFDVTDATGVLTWTDLPVGVYTLTASVLPDYTATTAPIQEAAVMVEDITEVLFGQKYTPAEVARLLYLPLILKDAGVVNLIRDVPHPNGIAANSTTNRVYIASKTTSKIYEVDGATNVVLDTLETGLEPFGVAVNRTTDRVYVANFAGDTLTVYSGASGDLLDTVDFSPMGYGSPAYVAVDEDANRIYVTLYQGGRVAVIDGSSNSLITTVPAEAGAFGVALHPGLARAYVSNRDTGNVTVVDTANNLPLWSQKFMPGGTPYALAVDTDRDRLYVVYALGGDFPDRVAVYSLSADGATLVGKVGVGDGGPDGGTGVAVNSTTGHVFVASSAEDTVTVFDGVTLAVLATVEVGDDPGMVGFNAATNGLYVSNRGDDTVQVIEDGF